MLAATLILTSKEKFKASHRKPQRYQQKALEYPSNLLKGKNVTENWYNVFETSSNKALIQIFNEDSIYTWDTETLVRRIDSLNNRSHLKITYIEGLEDKKATSYLAYFYCPDNTWESNNRNEGTAYLYKLQKEIGQHERIHYEIAAQSPHITMDSEYPLAGNIYRVGKNQAKRIINYFSITSSTEHFTIDKQLEKEGGSPASQFTEFILKQVLNKRYKPLLLIDLLDPQKVALGGINLIPRLYQIIECIERGVPKQSSPDSEEKKEEDQRQQSNRSSRSSYSSQSHQRPRSREEVLQDFDCIIA